LAKFLVGIQAAKFVSFAKNPETVHARCFAYAFQEAEATAIIEEIDLFDALERQVSISELFTRVRPATNSSRRPKS